MWNEVGIEVDMEPSGDQEIQAYQNFDKRELINLLMRAKSALGGKVPSPPMIPSAPTEGSEAGVPKAVDAPSYPYLKYSLPPLRPMPNGNQRCVESDVTATPKAEEANKENNGSWNTTDEDSNGMKTNGVTNNDSRGVVGGSGN